MKVRKGEVYMYIGENTTFYTRYSRYRVLNTTADKIYMEDDTYNSRHPEFNPTPHSWTIDKFRDNFVSCIKESDNNSELISESTPKETNSSSDSVNSFKEITDKMLETYKRKNHDYGNSFDKSLDKFGLVAAVVRMGDKMNRIESLINKETKVKDESIKDTLLDLASYSIMTLMWMNSKK